MSRTESYKVCMQIEVSHDFYTQNPVPLHLVPAQSTSKQLENARIIFKCLSAGRWVLLRPAGKYRDMDKMDLHFEARVMSSRFYYVTGSINQVEDALYTFSEPGIPGIWKLLKLHPEAIRTEDFSHIKWHIPGVEKFVEYICIPRYNTGDIHLKLTEDKGRLQFKEPEKTVLPDGSRGVRFISKEKILLRKDNTYKMKLWEIRNSGERLLSEVLPFPDPESMSFIRPGDTITSYYYF